jgi:hypothetical protein
MNYHRDLAVEWSAIGLFAGFALGSLFYLGARIDSTNVRIDSLTARMDARFDRVDAQFDAAIARLDAHIERHPG